VLSHDVTYTTTGTKASVDFDPAIAPFNASVVCTVTTGPASYKLQYTLSDFSSPTMTDAAAVWVDSVDIPAGTTASAAASLPFPITRLRMVIATLTAGSIQLQTRQGISTN
jgi:hypothetical protein